MATKKPKRRRKRPKRQLVDLVVDEISLVDRPAVPDARFIVVKRRTLGVDKPVNNSFIEPGVTVWKAGPDREVVRAVADLGGRIDSLSTRVDNSAASLKAREANRVRPVGKHDGKDLYEPSAIRIDELSLVRKPAWAHAKLAQREAKGDIATAWCPLLYPDQVDAVGAVALRFTPDCIAKSARRFIAQGGTFHVNHEGETQDVCIVDSLVLDKEQDLDGKVWPRGSWLVKVSGPSSLLARYAGLSPTFCSVWHDEGDTPDDDVMDALGKSWLAANRIATGNTRRGNHHDDRSGSESAESDGERKFYQEILEQLRNIDAGLDRAIETQDAIQDEFDDIVKRGPKYDPPPTYF